MLVVLLGFSMGARAQSPQAAKPGTTTPAAAPTNAPAQPIAFNHQLHMQTAKMTCNDCHEPRGNGSTLAMPQPPKCMTCHAGIATDKPDIKRLAEAAKNEDPIAWVRVYRVPSFVTFSHKTHISAGAKCEECHGPVAERTAIALEKDTSMGTCIACHQSKGAPATCDTCHAIMSKNGHSPFDVDPFILARLQVNPARNSASSSPRNTAASSSTSVLGFINAPLL
jgi:hypothetical protein